MFFWSIKDRSERVGAFLGWVEETPLSMVNRLALPEPIDPADVKALAVVQQRITYWLAETPEHHALVDHLDLRIRSPEAGPQSGRRPSRSGSRADRQEAPRRSPPARAVRRWGPSGHCSNDCADDLARVSGWCRNRRGEQVAAAALGGRRDSSIPRRDRQRRAAGSAGAPRSIFEGVLARPVKRSTLAFGRQDKRRDRNCHG